MLFHLMKKDFLLIKKYALCMLAASFLIPPFMLWRMPVYTNALGLAFSMAFSVFILIQYLFIKENQYAGASALLCAVPYPRPLLVLSKYCFFLISCLACCLTFSLDSLLLPGLGGFRPKSAIYVISALSLVFGIYMPLQYRLGYERTKFTFYIILLVLPVLLPWLLKTGTAMGWRLSSLTASSVFCGGVFLGSLIFLMISAALCVRLYENKEVCIGK